MNFDLKTFNGECPLFHYTDANGFIQILKNRQLWATDYRAMNDFSERSHFVDQLKNRIALEKFKSEAVRAAIKRVLELNWIHKRLLITSFSKVKDSLNQWILYGDQGKGFSLELNLPHKHRRSARFSYGEHATEDSISVIYDDQSGLSKIDDLVEAFKEIDKLLTLSGTDGSIQLSIVQWKTELLSLAFKNNTWSIEEEVRWIRTSTLRDSPDAYDWRPVNDVPVLYERVQLQDNEIKKVWIGPKNPSTEEEVRLFLDEVGLHQVKVEKSTCTLR